LRRQVDDPQAMLLRAVERICRAAFWVGQITTAQNRFAVVPTGKRVR